MCLMISLKLNSDFIYDLESFSYASKLKKNNIVLYEKILIKLLDYRFFVREEEYNEYNDSIKKLIINNKQEKDTK